MAQRKPTERTNKFLEITDPKKAVGLWSYKVVRETAMTPVGNTKLALGRFLPQDVARWKRREEMAAAMEAKRSAECGYPPTEGSREAGAMRGVRSAKKGERRKFKSPARIIAEYQEKAKQDTKRLKITDWQMKYRWLHLWERYACRLAAPSSVAGEKDTQMFFDAPSAGVNCHEGNLHSGRVFFLRTKVKGDLERRSLRDTQSFDRIGAARPLETPSGLGLSPSGNPTLSRGRIPTARVELSSSVAPTPQLDSVEGSSHPKNASGAFSDSGVGSEATVVAGSENDLLSRSAQADCVQKSQYRYFVAVVLKPGGTKWWSQIDHCNVTWTDNVYDRLIIDPRGKLEWSPILAEVINEQVVEKNICLFMLEDDALFKAITDHDLNPHEKYAHLCYDFDFFCRNPEGGKVKVEGEQRTIEPSFYLRWSAFFNPKRSKFDLASKQNPRVIEVMSERKKGWITRQIEVKEQGLGIGDSGNEVKPRKIVRHGNKSITALSKEDVAKVRTSDAKLGLGDTPLDKYVQDVAQWVAANNGCAVLPAEASRELRLALSHALFFVTFPDRKPDEVGGILRGYQLPGRLVEHAQGKVHGDNSERLRARVQKQSEEATARRRKMVVDCLFTRACTAVLLRNNGSVLERRSLRDTQSFDRIGAATTARVESSSTVAPTPQLDSVEGSSRQSEYALSAFDKVTEKTIVPIMESIGARATLEKAAWQLGCMTGNPLMLFKSGPTAGNLKLPDLSLALCFEQKLGLKGETAGDEMVVQTAPIRTLKDSQGAIRVSLDGAYPCRSVWTPSPGKEKGNVAYPSDSVRIIRDETGYYLMAVPKYGQYHTERDLAFEPDVPGKPRYKGLGIRDQGLGKGGVPVRAYSVKSVGGVRSRADSFVVEEVYEFNKLMKLARDGRIYLYAIDFGRDKWLADLVYSTENKRPCKIVPTIPILANEGVAKDDALEDSRKNGSDMMTKVPLLTERCNAYITFTFNPTVARENRKVEGRSWKSYCDAFPAEKNRTIIRWPDGGDLERRSLRDTQNLAKSDVATTARVESSSSVAPTPQSDFAKVASLNEALQKVIETDGVLLTDKEHIEEAIRAATYVVKDDPYRGYILKDRIFKDSDGRVEWRATQELSDSKENVKRREWSKKRFREQKGKPLCEVLSPDLAKAAEAEFTRQIEADTLVDAKTPKTFKLESPIKVTDDFKDAVAREFKRIAYTGTMGWRKKLNRPAHEVAVGIWLAGLGSGD